MDDQRDVDSALHADREGAELSPQLPPLTRAVASRRVKLLLVSLYWPPAGGGGVQRPLKFAQYLPALGIETHVLAPDDPKWIHEDAELRQPDAGLGAPRPLPRPEGAQARRGAARQGGASSARSCRPSSPRGGCSSRTRT